MTIEHSNITDPEIHEPKGVATASGDQVYIADGAGSGDWRYFPHSALYYDDIGGTGTTLTAPTSYTLIGPATTGDTDPHEFTHNSLGRLTYTGTSTLDFNVAVSITLTHSSASLVDVLFQIHVNGSPVSGAQHGTAALSGNYTHASLISHVSLSSNDYVEVFAKTASGNIIIWAISFTVEGKI